MGSLELYRAGYALVFYELMNPRARFVDLRGSLGDGLHRVFLSSHEKILARHLTFVKRRLSLLHDHLRISPQRQKSGRYR